MPVSIHFFAVILAAILITLKEQTANTTIIHHVNSITTFNSLDRMNGISDKSNQIIKLQ
jgi:hypothetical protein